MSICSRNLPYLLHYFLDVLPVLIALGGFFVLSVIAPIVVYCCCCCCCCKCEGQAPPRGKCHCKSDCSAARKFSCMDDVIKPTLVQYLPPLKEANPTQQNEEQDRQTGYTAASKKGSIKIIQLHKIDVPDSFLFVMFLLLIYIGLLTAATFWEVFIFEESCKCETDTKFTCFKNEQKIMCFNDTNATGIYCYKFAFKTADGLSAAVVVLGAGITAFGVITFILMSLMKCSKVCTSIAQGIGFVLIIAAFVTQIVIHHTDIYKFRTEEFFKFGANLLVIASAILLPAFIIGCCDPRKCCKYIVRTELDI